MQADGEGRFKIKGYYPGVIGKIIELHAAYYFENWGFDITFETQVGKELSDFISESEEERDGLWVALMGGEFAGSIAIDGRKVHQEGARLRWFIVPPQYQGLGIGRESIEKAVTFCRERGHGRIFLWTFEGLRAARALYERTGFRLRTEHRVCQWGQNITEQMFVLNL
jgi:GNAT superfamily N-acetyltransferase